VERSVGFDKVGIGGVGTLKDGVKGAGSAIGIIDSGEIFGGSSTDWVSLGDEGGIAVFKDGD
jgi:hypothetical protein